MGSGTVSLFLRIIYLPRIREISLRRLAFSCASGTFTCQHTASVVKDRTTDIVVTVSYPMTAMPLHVVYRAFPPEDDQSAST
jgi:hypothetical protein